MNDVNEAVLAHPVAQALRRVQSVLERRPEVGLHDDAPASVRWNGGLGFVASHANGCQVRTDMPAELGGSGQQVSPGWLLRAGLASCTATCVAMAAAAEGIELELLEAHASSRSDTRGLLGLAEDDGSAVPAGPRDVVLSLRIAARGVAPTRLRALVDGIWDRSPVPLALRQATPVALQVEVVGA